MHPYRVEATVTSGVATKCAYAVLLINAAINVVVASESTFGVTFGLGATDNVYRSAADPQSAIIAAPGIDFSVSESRRRFSVDAYGDIAYQDYLTSAVQNEVLGKIIGRGKITLIPDLFDWSVGEDFGQVTENQSLAPSPGNRESVNYFSTGPLLTIGSRSATQLRLEGNYAKVHYQVSPLDNERYVGSVSVIRELSSYLDISLNAHSERVQYEDPSLNPSNDLQQAFLRIDAKGSKMQVKLDAGYARAKSDLASESLPIFRFNASQVVSPFSSIQLTLGREFADTVNLFTQILEAQGPRQATLEIQPTSEFFTSTFGIAAWSAKYNRTSLRISLSQYKQAYELASSNNQTITGVNGTISRQVSASTQINAYTNWSRNRYDIVTDNSTDRDFGIGLTRRLGRKLSLDLQYVHLDRTATDASQASKVNEIWLRLYYGTGPGVSQPFFVR